MSKKTPEIEMLADSDTEIEVPIDPSRLLFEGVAESITDEMIGMYITLIFNPSLDEGFKIEEMRRNRKRVQIKFNYNVDYSEVLARQKKLPALGGSAVGIKQVRVPDTVRVSELKNTATKELLQLYFSNSKVSSGGDIKSIKMYSFENKALVQFRDYNKVQDVLARTHIICEALVKLEKYWGPIEEEYIRDEEEADSGLDLDVRARMQRKSLAQINAMRSLTQTPVQNIDKTKLVVASIQENVTIQQIDFYIKLLTHGQEINEINWSLENKGRLLIDFKKEVDIAKIVEEFHANPALSTLNGKSVQIETVNVTRTLVVLVKDFRPKKQTLKLDSPNDIDEYRPETIPATRDLLDLYFVNRQRSGGGEVESIERKSSRYWLVVMKDHRSVKEILSRRHVVDEKPIKVFPYYSNFGLPYLFRPLFDDYHSQSSSLGAFKLKIKDERLRYFGKVRTLIKKLNDILSESNAVARYNKQESNILYVNYYEKLETKVPYTERMWRLRVKESIEYFLHIYKYEKITLSHNQWVTISRAKQLNENFLRAAASAADDESSSLVGGSVNLDESQQDAAGNDPKVKYIGNNCAITSINETTNNVEISVVGPNAEVDKFIVKIKDIICKAYFTFELEEKIIKFKTYLYECEDLLAKWLNESADGGYDSDTEFTLASARFNDSDSMSGISRLKLNKSRRNTIDEFISKLERDHLDMELSYGKLFQELGYTFLTNIPQDSFDDADDGEYKDFNDRIKSGLDDTVLPKPEQNESQMDKIKYTLDDLRLRITEMRKKFKQFLAKSKRSAAGNKSGTTSGRAPAAGSGDLSEEVDLDDEDEDDAGDEDDTEELFKLCVYVMEQKKIVTFKIHKRCRVRELKQILLEKVADASKINSIDEIKLTYNNVELINDGYTISDYGVGDKATITLEFRLLDD